MPGVNAWSTNVTWGDALTSTGDTVEWGVRKTGGRSWRVECLDQTCSTVQWGGSSQNVVWGTACGADCQGTTWTVAGAAAPLTDANAATVVWGHGRLGKHGGLGEHRCVGLGRRRLGL